MFQAHVYRVMIGSLSGSMEEVFTAKEVVRQWNQQNAEAKGKLYLPVEWTTRAEEIQIIDVVIGMVGNWIANPDFVQKCAKAGKKVVLLFNDYQDPRNTIQSEYDTVVAFKHRMRDVCACADYHDKSSLADILNGKLDNLQ